MTTKTKKTPTPPGQLALGLTTPVLSRSQQADRPDREARLAAARAVLARGVAGVRDDPAALGAYLAFRAHFHEYSARNALLIWMQRPTARHCMGYKAWTAHGRRVRRGERGITVLAPVLRRPTAAEVVAGADPDDRVPAGFKTATTFDYEQTEPVADDALVYAPPVPRLDAEGPDGLVDRLEAAARSIGYAVETVDTGYADGRCRFDRRVVEVRAGLSPADRAAVLAHELAHAVAHAPGPDGPGADADGPGRPSRASMELQAEGSAYVALAALGLDTARCSLPYLKGWAGGDDDALAAELGAVDRVAARVLALVDGAGPGGTDPGGAAPTS